MTDKWLKLSLLTAICSAWAADDPMNLSIEQLMQSEVQTVTRTHQSFADTAAAVYVITQEDIQRSGVTTIPDALRLAPGVQVAQVRSGEWAISARGFSGVFANKLQVLIDGRSIYTPTFAGVRWRNYDLILDDISRIEVIRGPGSSVWGHNAVNGVINIITKNSADTQGGWVTATTGNKDQALLETRYGDQLNEQTHYRVFGKFTHRDSQVDYYQQDAEDDWTQGRGGFRLDWNPNSKDHVTFSGDGYIDTAKAGFLLPTDPPDQPQFNALQNSGAHGRVRWEHDLSLASKITTQIYYELFRQEDAYFGDERQHTADFDFQHDLALNSSHYFNWGLAYRYVSDEVLNSAMGTMRPNQLDLHLASAFIQDKVMFFDDQMELTWGSKIQYYTLSDWNWMPSARLMWKWHPEHRLWASFSKSIRSPSRGETALDLNRIRIVKAFPFYADFNPNSRLDEEHILSYELGYRGWFGSRASLDVALFYNHYDELVTGSFSEPDFLRRQITVQFANGAKADTWGIESTFDWRPMDKLRLLVSYTYFERNYENYNLGDEEHPHSDPMNQLSCRLSYDIAPTLKFDAWIRYVDSVQAHNTLYSEAQNVPSRVGLDLRLAWHALPSLELILAGQNINQSEHTEYIEETLAYPEQIERSLYGQMRWSF